MLSIVIPVLNQHEMTMECIATVIENTPPCEIIVVDNGSEPPIKYGFVHDHEVRIIRNEENKGFPVAVNQGIRSANGDTVILLNNDVVVTPNWSEKLATALDEYSIVAPVTNYCAGMQCVQVSTYTNRDELNGSAQEWAENYQSAVQDVNFVIGFCMAFKKHLFDEIGEFDESLWPCSGEEIDFCFRTRKAGHKIGIAVDCYVHHEGSRTFKDMQNAGQVDYNGICARNDMHLAEKYGVDFWLRQAVEEGEDDGSGI